MKSDIYGIDPASINIAFEEKTNILPQGKPNIKIIATNNYQEFCSAMAEQIRNQLKTKANSNLGLPAGHSPVGCYELLARPMQNKELNWQQVKCFALDDYLDVDAVHTFQYFFETHLYRHINLPATSKFNPSLVDNYDQLIADCGGIDLCMLGLGVNGHVAFNEPPTDAQSWTHCVFLTETTRKINSRDFADKIVGAKAGNPVGVDCIDPLSVPPVGAENAGAHAAPLQSPAAKDMTNIVDAVPTRAITMGIATILASKRIILAVSGEQKKPALLRALREPPDASSPASFLTTHKDLLVITDFPFMR